MSVPNDDKRFLDLLQKWRDGDFTHGNEQELEALARGDDFRREALEGFWMNPEADHSTRLLALRARLQPEKAVRRVIFPQMWAAAAALVLLLAALWFFRAPAPDPVDTMVQNQLPAPEANPLADAANPVPAQTEPQRSKSIPTIPSPQPSATTSGAIAQADPDRSVSVENKDFEAAPPPVVMSETEAVAEDIAVQPASDDAAKETATKQEESVVEVAKPSRKKAATPDQMVKTLPGQQAPANAMQTDDFEMIALQDYLRRNARLPEAARQNNISGYVQVSIRLNKRKKVVDTQVLRSLGFGCDEAAVSLIKAYDWRDFSKDTLTVDVPFVR